MKLNRFRKNVFFLVFLSLAVMFSGIYFTYSLKTEKQINEMLKDVLTDEIKTSKDGIENILKGYEDFAYVLASNPDMRNFSDSKEYELKTEEILRGAQKTKSNEIYDIYIGDMNKRMLSAVSTDEELEGYDPQYRDNGEKKDWYWIPADEKKTYWSDIYRDVISNQQMITVAVPIVNNQDVHIGTMGVDYFLSDINKAVSSKKLLQNGIYQLVDFNGKIVSDKNFNKDQKDSSVGRWHFNKDIVEYAKNKDEKDIKFFDIGSDTNIYSPDVMKNAKSDSDLGDIANQMEDLNENGDLVDDIPSYIFSKEMKSKMYPGEYKAIAIKLPNTNLTLVGMVDKKDIDTYVKEVNKASLTIMYIFIPLITLMMIFAYRRIIGILGIMTYHIDQMAGGYFSFRTQSKDKSFIEVFDKLNEASESVEKAMNETKGTFKDVSDNILETERDLDNVRELSEKIEVTIAEVSKGIYDQSEDAVKGASNVGNISYLIEDINKNTKKLASKTSEVNKINSENKNNLEELRKKSNNAKEVSDEITGIVDMLNDNTQNIGNIVETIDSIASQTNLLALNASIEAARAGEAGKGFAVVADEIRKLAEETGKSTNKIGEIVSSIKAISQKVASSIGDVNLAIDEQIGSAENVESSFEVANGIYREFENSFEEIYHQLGELNVKNAEIEKSITNMAAVSEETAASGEEIHNSVENQRRLIEGTAKSLDSMKEKVTILGDKLNQFK